MADRLFVAARPAAAFIAGLRRAVARLEADAPPGLRWVPEANWHVTLQFLGDVDPDRTGELRAACEAAAAQVPPFEITCGDLGTFGNPRRARLLWMGLREGAESLSSLADAVCRQTALLGFVADPRPFTPHLTLARARRPVDVEGLVNRWSIPNAVGSVADLILYRSVSSPGAPSYQPLVTCPFVARS